MNTRNGIIILIIYMLASLIVSFLPTQIIIKYNSISWLLLFLFAFGLGHMYRGRREFGEGHNKFVIFGFSLAIAGILLSFIGGVAGAIAMSPEMLITVIIVGAIAINISLALVVYQIENKIGRLLVLISILTLIFGMVLGLLPVTSIVSSVLSIVSLVLMLLAYVIALKEVMGKTPAT